MSNPITSPTKYYDLEGLKRASQALADANGLHGYDPVLRDSRDRPLELGAASTNAIAHALSSAYLAYDHSAAEATALGWAREHKSYWFESKRPAAWDTFKDLYINQDGRNIADYVRQNNLSRDQIQDLILDALSSGKLIVTQQDKRIDPSFNGSPSNFSLPVGDAVPWTAPSAGFSDFASSVTRVPFAPPNGSVGGTSPLAHNGFGSGSPAGDAGNLRSPVLRALQNYKRSAAPGGPPPTSGIVRGNPNQPALSAEPAPLLGIVSGKPRLPSSLPPAVFGLPDESGASGKSDWFNFLAGIAAPNSTPSAPPPNADSSQVRILSRRIVGRPPAPVSETSAPAASLAPSDDANFSGGLLGRLAALAGIDPQDSTQLAPPPLDDRLRGFYRDNPMQPWFVQRQR